MEHEVENQSVAMADIGPTLQYFEAFDKAFREQSFSTNTALYSVSNRYYTPDIINSVMKRMNNTPVAPKSTADILEALATTNESERILRDYATFFEINNVFYKRLIHYNAELPAFNLTFDCFNANEAEDYNSSVFKKDLAVVDNFCSRTNIRQEFRRIVSQIIRQGVYYGVFRDEGDIYTWQELPAGFSKITGDSNIGKLFSFNFAYFIEDYGANIDMYPKVFHKLLKQVWDQVGEKYDPKGNIDRRHSSFVYWLDVSPKDNFFCFTLDDGLVTLIPYYSGLFPDMFLQPMMRELEKNKAMIAAQKLLVNLIETYDNAKSGTVPNQYKITPKDIGQFMALVKQAIGDAVKAVAIPAKDAKVVDFNVEAENRYTSYEVNIAKNAVASSTSLMASGKLNAFESQLALTIDENFVKAMYSQFEKMMMYYINRRTDKYKFKIKLSDTNTIPDRAKRKEDFRDLAMMGIVDMNLYARMTDQNIFEAKRALQLTKSLGLEENLISLLSLNNQSSSFTQGRGRPKEENTTNDNTMRSQERESNDLQVE